ncbi:hypothetical protein IFM89_020939 [Coptis chinensis]|uniref:Uncharacterized protein n=1 Tax=Coptis chinensis TaxID=261450 RepID=A0A835IRM4_9MAGN|nr:hypothetical protein IFM89_020939 [Coptis chinensis]
MTSKRTGILGQLFKNLRMLGFNNNNWMVEGMEMALSNGWTKVYIESDSTAVSYLLCSCELVLVIEPPSYEKEDGDGHKFSVKNMELSINVTEKKERYEGKVAALNCLQNKLRRWELLQSHQSLRPLGKHTASQIFKSIGNRCVAVAADQQYPSLSSLA